MDGKKLNTGKHMMLMSHHVYIVLCKDGTLYTGYTKDVIRRVKEHNGMGKRGAKYTKTRRPVTLVWQAAFESRSTALKYEYAIKQMSHNRKLKLINGL